MNECRNECLFLTSDKNGLIVAVAYNGVAGGTCRPSFSPSLLHHTVSLAHACSFSPTQKPSAERSQSGRVVFVILFS
jgi:hypothetical protein